MMSQRCPNDAPMYPNEIQMNPSWTQNGWLALVEFLIRVPTRQIMVSLANKVRTSVDLEFELAVITLKRVSPKKKDLTPDDSITTN